MMNNQGVIPMFDCRSFCRFWKQTTFLKLEKSYDRYFQIFFVWEETAQGFQHCCSTKPSNHTMLLLLRILMFALLVATVAAFGPTG
jgi:hypothetical protein